MTEAEMKKRTQSFALRILKLSNYRALCRSKSRADFINKTAIVEEEADETSFWLDMIVEAGLLKHEQVVSLAKEADELTAMLVASRKTASKSRAGN